MSSQILYISQRQLLNYSFYKILYSKYKEIIIVVALLLVSILLLFFAVIPQFQDWQLTLDEEHMEQAKISILKNNYAQLAGLNDAQIDTDVTLVSQAFPIDKDFIGVLGAISRAAVKSGVSLQDYTFSVGQLTPTGPSQKKPSLDLKVIVKGSVGQTQQFITQLASQLPLSEITKIDVGQQNSTIALSFYYNPFQELTFQADVPVKLLSTQDTQLLDKLSQWKQDEENTIIPGAVGNINPLLPLSPSPSSSTSAL